MGLISDVYRFNPSHIEKSLFCVLDDVDSTLFIGLMWQGDSYREGTSGVLKIAGVGEGISMGYSDVTTRTAMVM